MKKLVAAVVAVTTSIGLSLPAEAGKDGPGGGMSGGMSRSMGSSMSARSMGGSTSMRSMGGSSMSSRSMSMPRGMSGSTFSNPARSIGGSGVGGSGVGGSGLSSRRVIPNGNVGGNVSRNVGSSIAGSSNRGGAKVTPGGLGNIVRGVPNAGSFNNSKSPISKNLDRGVVRDVAKGNLNNLVGRGAVKDFGKGKLGSIVGSKDPAGRNGNIIAGGLKTGRIRTGELAKIDRSKLRDLVRGIESGKAGGGGLLPGGGSKSLEGIVKGFDKAKLAGAIHLGGLKQFKSGNLLAGKGGFNSKSAGLLAAAGFHHHGHHHDHHHHHHHGHWFDFCFGDFWFDYHYDYPHYDYCHYEPHYYEPCWYPVYTYPACGVTFAPYPEVVTVAATQPIVLDQEITLAAATEEVEAAKPVVEDGALAGTNELEAIFGGTVGDTTADETANDDTEETATEESTTTEATVEVDAVETVIAETRTSENKPIDPSVQPDMDLELINVEMVSAGSRETNVGPSFKVTIRNTGKRNLEKFLVSLVACKDAQIDSNSVHASTTVEELAAGGETSISVTLPLEAMSLGSDAQGRRAPYKTLVAAVDSDERISEGNEDNNLALIDRTSIQLANN